mmetsp:Transcript_3273/g.9259  ORF Transcript_3273/g.9259 Transcript_3273/m.9259 type:complete len:428 (+) Transcript_3273:315-1598(+)
MAGSSRTCRMAPRIRGESSTTPPSPSSSSRCARIADPVPSPQQRAVSDRATDRILGETSGCADGATGPPRGWRAIRCFDRDRHGSAEAGCERCSWWARPSVAGTARLRGLRCKLAAPPRGHPVPRRGPGMARKLVCRASLVSTDFGRRPCGRRSCSVRAQPLAPRRARQCPTSVARLDRACPSRGGGDRRFAGAASRHRARWPRHAAAAATTVPPRIDRPQVGPDTGALPGRGPCCLQAAMRLLPGLGLWPPAARTLGKPWGSLETSMLPSRGPWRLTMAMRVPPTLWPSAARSPKKHWARRMLNLAGLPGLRNRRPIANLTICSFLPRRAHSPSPGPCADIIQLLNVLCLLSSAGCLAPRTPDAWAERRSEMPVGAHAGEGMVSARLCSWGLNASSSDRVRIDSRAVEATSADAAAATREVHMACE